MSEYVVGGLIAACKTLSPASSEWHWRISQAVALQPMLPGKRVWTRVTYPVQHEAFISINPGEFRSQQPSEPTDLILPMPSLPEDDRLVDRLRTLKEDVASVSEESVRVSVERLVGQYSAGSKQSAELIVLFEEADKVLRSDASRFSASISSLYKEGLENRQMPLHDFSAAMLLLQIQAISRQWIESGRKRFWSKSPSPYTDPTSSFLAYVRGLANRVESSIDGTKLARIGNDNYDWAAESIKRGINSGSLRDLTRELELAYHQYQTAYLVARAVEETAMECPLTYSRIQAEEGVVSTHCGLLEPLNFSSNEPDDMAEYLLASLHSGIEESSVIGAYASPRFPFYTKKFMRVLLAHARSLSVGPEFSQGVRELEQLETEFSRASNTSETRFENGWIDRALLNAYRKKPDTAEAEAYAMKIAIALIMERQSA